jgi:hypothetical protein
MKKCPPQSRRDFELDARARAPTVTDVLLSFSCELRAVAPLGTESGDRQFCLNSVPSVDIAAADMNDCVVAVFTVDGKNSLTTLKGDQASRLIEIRTRNVQMTVVRWFQSLE